MGLRYAVIVLILLGIVVGGLLPVSVLSYITAFIVGFLIVFLWRENKNAPGGTSGAMGLTFMLVGGTACLLIPAWLVQLLK